ncbi:MAG: DNA translocase FtsK 4TM domain-containing protein [Puniceicoccales bacterium]|nr:DNA translocase FtsK 4TM domain-containing protein [Puniceicoccales bacterium]
MARRHITLGVVFFVFSLMLFAAFVDFSPSQTRFVSAHSYDPFVRENIFGEFGSSVVFLSMRYFGFAAWLLPIGLIAGAYSLFSPRLRVVDVGRTVAFLIMLVSAAGFLEFLQGNCMSAEYFLRISKNKFSGGLGGTVGFVLFRPILEKIFASVGSAVLLFTAFSLSAMYVFSSKSPPLDMAKDTKDRGCFPHGLGWLLGRFFAVLYAILSWICHSVFWILLKVFGSGNGGGTKIDSNVKKKPADVISQGRSTVRETSRGNYVLPTLELLQRAKKTSSDDDHAAISKQLVDTLAQFGIAVRSGEVHVGPVITRYEISPAPGVRVEKIVNLDKNIALNLRAQSVRILAPVPGRGCVGVELPNRNPQMVCLREILESQDWNDVKADIPIVLGRGTTGEPMINDLAKMPHLLIAGATGSGKTVCINSIIASLVYHSAPDDLRFIMVDPKIVEMQVFNDLPHMLIPVVTDPKKVPNALKWLISEMELRYKIFAKVGVRNIAGFNARIMKNASAAARADELDQQLSPEERSAASSVSTKKAENVDVPEKKIPYIVCIIDELADLMMVAPADIETCVARLAQLARAAGIHLILATQRPSVNVITGIIKANLPSRIAFKVASKVDSRTILDSGGAEALLGRGDMLFQPPGASGLLRAQGALVSDEEINKIVDFLRDRNGPPEYAMDVHAMIESGEQDGEDFEDWEDEMMPRALEVIRSSDRASTSMLQRRLKIGYNRAARIMEALEAKGLVSNQGGQSRDEIDM